MGFLFHAIKIPRLINPTFLWLWSHLKLITITALTHLGLYKPTPPQQIDYYSPDHTNDIIFILDGTSPSLIPIPIHLVISAIKNRLPILHYWEFVALKELLDAAVIGETKEVVCTICLEKIQDYEEVRELCRCSHVFHRDCLDKWVDSSQVTCPLCRSLLFPPNTNLFMSPHNSSNTK